MLVPPTIALLASAAYVGTRPSSGTDGRRFEAEPLRQLSPLACRRLSAESVVSRVTLLLLRPPMLLLRLLDCSRAKPYLCAKS
uniref:Putative secreted protein n=1 Tax=Ixodes ricinus TaxID=34613 RepID=A0A6B0TX50_IXORI